jgi:hypothetical protein
MNEFMIFYRERDYQYFLFNGEWPIGILPKAEPFGEGIGTDEKIAFTEKLIPEFKAILNSKKKVFFINKQRYIVTYRGTFVKE